MPSSIWRISGTTLAADSADAADKWIDKLFDAFETIARMPGIGQRFIKSCMRISRESFSGVSTASFFVWAIRSSRTTAASSSDTIQRWGSRPWKRPRCFVACMTRCGVCGGLNNL
jgi:plasmid stabilization system protein ParE